MVRKDRIMLKFFYIVLLLITVLIDAALLELGKHTLIEHFSGRDEFFV